MVTADGDYNGLLNIEAGIISARSSVSGDVNDDFLREYLPQILAFMGINCIGSYCLEATGCEAEIQQKLFIAEKKKIDWQFSNHAKADWIGNFSEEDKYAISEIRDKQAEAIMAGDAEKYASLCAEDIQLMIPQHSIISGKQDFLAAEKQLFNSATFNDFVKTPLRVERQGNLVVEVGHQVVRMSKSASNEGVFAALQKYLHVYRLTSLGWRYSVLMSNAIE
jgi:ketosteroid isomerase-like protein